MAVAYQLVWVHCEMTTVASSEEVTRRRRIESKGCTGGMAVGGPTVEMGVAPQLWTAHPRGPSRNIPIRASKGMACPDLEEIGFGRGRGFSPKVFPAPLQLV